MLQEVFFIYMNHNPTGSLLYAIFRHDIDIRVSSMIFQTVLLLLLISYYYYFVFIDQTPLL